jgi:hypothetical protein
MSTEPLFKIEQSEAQFQASVMQLATMYGWEWLHIQKAMNDRAYHRTPAIGSLGPGWPDLVLLKGNRLIFAELKSEKGKVTPNQRGVLGMLSATGHQVFLWRPSDWDRIVEVLNNDSGT